MEKQINRDKSYISGYLGLKVRVKSTEKGQKVDGNVLILNLGNNYAAAAAKSLQLCPTLCNPMDCSPPGSSVHGIFQARVPEWLAIAFSNGNDYTTVLMYYMGFPGD